ncbi:unnamed protein product, partial [Notodromas monacha]
DVLQLVILSFDDAMTWELYRDFYAVLFNEDRKNPDGCPIRGSFFLQHDYTNYSLVHDLWRMGHELGSHSMTHKVPAESWADMPLEEYTKEMVGLRLVTEEYARIPPGQITGVRAPFLQMNGNNYTQMIRDNGFTYDASRPTRQQMDTGIWPYTYDFVYQENLFLDCPIPPCPSDAFPGIWQVPINDLNDTKGIECAMLDQCSGRPESEAEALELLGANFYRHYNGNRTPFNLFTHASWFQGDWTHNFDALQKWIDEVLTMGDVYIVPARTAVAFMKEPIDSELASVGAGPLYTCGGVIPNRDCRLGPPCDYCDPTGKGSARLPAEVIMAVCGNCPPCFPTPDDPIGMECAGENPYPRCPARD